MFSELLGRYICMLWQSGKHYVGQSFCLSICNHHQTTTHMHPARENPWNTHLSILLLVRATGKNVEPRWWLPFMDTFPTFPPTFFYLCWTQVLIDPAILIFKKGGSPWPSRSQEVQELPKYATQCWLRWFHWIEFYSDIPPLVTRAPFAEHRRSAVIENQWVKRRLLVLRCSLCNLIMPILIELNITLCHFSTQGSPGSEMPHFPAITTD